MFFVFFKQKTAYEMLRSLVGSEMCIRDRVSAEASIYYLTGVVYMPLERPFFVLVRPSGPASPVSYTHLTLPTIYSV